ncbi:hypothetical protein [Aeromonas sp. s11]|uniref:hypothetical protein n=1 Tax=Aeromonas sp. s11 TaxID=3138481 RepID=UPI0034A408CB
MGIDKVGHRSMMLGVWYFFCCKRAQAGDIKGQSAIARRKYTDKKLQYSVCEGGAKLACQQEGIFT